MLLHRKDEIVKKAAENNQLLFCGRMPVQFLQDYYNEYWHVKAGTLAYVKVGTVLTTITESNGKESVECRIIAALAAGKDTIEIPAIAYEDGTLLVKGEKIEPSPCREVFAPPSDSDLKTMRTYEEVNAKIEKEEEIYDKKFGLAAVITFFTGFLMMWVVGVAVWNSDPFLTSFITVLIMAFVVIVLLPILCGTKKRRLKKQKKELEDELLRKDAENVQLYEKGEKNQ